MPVLGLSLAVAHSQPAPQLASHRAVYDLTLDDATDRAGISAADGRVVYEVNGSSCEGYTSSFRLVLRIFDTKGASQLTDLQTSTYESKDGFDFTVRTFANGVPTEDTRGRARHDGDAVAVDLKRPDAESFSLSGKALFPYEHTQAIIDTARAGGHILEATTFDGSEGGRALSPTLSVIGQPIGTEVSTGAGDAAGAAGRRESKRGEDDAAAVARIGEGPAWPVTVSYYASSTRMEESEPVYEISFIQHADGVTRRLRLDYGEFAVSGALKDIEYYEPAAPCPTD